MFLQQTLIQRYKPQYAFNTLTVLQLNQRPGRNSILNGAHAVVSQQVICNPVHKETLL